MASSDGVPDMTVSTLTPISPTEVHGILARYMLADGFDLVFD
jgi:hypothetical protein